MRATHFFCQLIFLIFSYLGYAQERDSLKQLFELKKYDTVISTLIKAEENGVLTMQEYYWLTRSLGRIGQYANGLVYAKKMQDQCLKEKDTVNLLKAINLATENFVDLGEMKDGLTYVEGVLPLFRPKDSIEYQKLCFKLGLLYYYNGEYQKAYETYNSITKPEYRSIPLFYNNYALTLMGVENWDEALIYFKKALNQAQAFGKKDEIHTHYSNIASVYSYKKEYRNVKKYLDSAVASFTSKSQLRTQKAVYKQYFNLYKHQGHIDAALGALDVMKAYNDKIFDERISEKIRALENSGKRETILKEKVKTIDDKLVVSQRQNIWFAIVFLLIIIILITIVYIYKFRNIKVAHEHIVTEQRLLRSQMTPHFIFNSLSVLQGMILNNEDKKAVKYLSNFSKLLRLILESSREKVVTISEELQALQNYVDLQNMGRENGFEYNVNVSEAIDQDEYLIPPMLIQPFVENAIEHAFDGSIATPKIMVSLLLKEDKLICTIRDNGIGITSEKANTNETKKSLATKITAERLNIIAKQFRISANLTIYDLKDRGLAGTEVIFNLPYKSEYHA